MNDDSASVPEDLRVVPHEDRSLYDQEVAELAEMTDLFENMVEMRPTKAYTPNRADRRAMSKQRRKKGRPNRRG